MTCSLFPTLSALAPSCVDAVTVRSSEHTAVSCTTAHVKGQVRSTRCHLALVLKSQAFKGRGLGGVLVLVLLPAPAFRHPAPVPTTCSSRAGVCSGPSTLPAAFHAVPRSQGGAQLTGSTFHLGPPLARLVVDICTVFLSVQIIFNDLIE